MASLYIKDEEANALAEKLATARGLTKTAAVKLALRHELERPTVPTPPVRKRSSREIVEQFWREHPMPPSTGLKADKAFFDELSGDL